MSIKLYDILEVTEILKVHRRTVYNYIKEGQLKATKMGKYLRVREEDLQDFISRGTGPTSFDKRESEKI